MPMTDDEMKAALNGLTTEFFGHAAPITFEINDGLPIVSIHNPYHPEALPFMIGALAAMAAVQEGLDAPTGEMLDEVEIVARDILQRSITSLESGADRVGILVDFGEENEPNEPDD